MEYLAALDGQVVLTTTDPFLVRKAAFGQAIFLAVQSGRITPENPVFSE